MQLSIAYPLSAALATKSADNGYAPSTINMPTFAMWFSASSFDICLSDASLQYASFADLRGLSAKGRDSGSLIILSSQYLSARTATCGCD